MDRATVNHHASRFTNNQEVLSTRLVKCNFFYIAIANGSLQTYGALQSQRKGNEGVGSVWLRGGEVAPPTQEMR